MNLELLDGENEELLKKNKKKKSLGTIQLNISMTQMTKEQMNEAIFSFFASLSLQFDFAIYLKWLWHYTYFLKNIAAVYFDQCLVFLTCKI